MSKVQNFKFVYFLIFLFLIVLQSCNSDAPENFVLGTWKPDGKKKSSIVRLTVTSDNGEIFTVVSEFANPPQTIEQNGEIIDKNGQKVLKTTNLTVTILPEAGKLRNRNVYFIKE